MFGINVETGRKTRKNKQAAKFSPRVRFNWGYHDGASDAGRGQAREVVEVGQQSIKVVSKEYDAAYFHGYAAGVAAQGNGDYVANGCRSTVAWDLQVAAGLFSAADCWD